MPIVETMELKYECGLENKTSESVIFYWQNLTMGYSIVFLYALGKSSCIVVTNRYSINGCHIYKQM